MIVYKVFCKGDELEKDDLIGVLAERRKDLRGKTQVESGLKWARQFFTGLVKDKQAIFVVPHEFKVRESSMELDTENFFNTIKGE
jgi:hypothetical protein